MDKSLVNKNMPFVDQKNIYFRCNCNNSLLNLWRHAVFSAADDLGFCRIKIQKKNPEHKSVT